MTTVVLARAQWPVDDTDAELPAIAGLSSRPSARSSRRSPSAACPAISANRRPTLARGERTAIVLATSTGDLATAAAVAAAVQAGRRVPPLLFYQSNPNAVAGYIAARWGLAGPVVCTMPGSAAARAVGRRTAPGPDLAGARRGACQRRLADRRRRRRRRTRHRRQRLPRRRGLWYGRTDRSVLVVIDMKPPMPEARARALITARSKRSYAMKIHGFDHVEYYVEDLEKSAEGLCGSYGFRLAGRSAAGMRTAVGPAQARPRQDAADRTSDRRRSGRRLPGQARRRHRRDRLRYR